MSKNKVANFAEMMQSYMVIQLFYLSLIFCVLMYTKPFYVNQIVSNFFSSFVVYKILQLTILQKIIWHLTDTETLESNFV